MVLFLDNLTKKHDFQLSHASKNENNVKLLFYRVIRCHIHIKKGFVRNYLVKIQSKWLKMYKKKT